MDISAVIDRIRVITHSAIRIESVTGTVVYFDPFSLTEADAAHDADAVFITHAHFDHFSPEDIARVARPDTVVVAPACMAENVATLHLPTKLMRAGEHATVAGMAVEAVPAYNTDPARLQNHPRANGWLGYVLTVDGARIYVAGDTDQNAENEQVRCDIALVPVGGTYTMDPAQAAAFVNDIRPRATIPTHYGTIVGSATDAGTFTAAVDPAITVAEKRER